MNAQSLFQRVTFSILCCLGFGASAASVDCNFLAVSNAVATGGIHTLACGGTIVFPQILSVSPGTTVTLEATGTPVTFDGDNARLLFSIAAGGRLVLKNVRLVRGFGGAIRSSVVVQFALRSRNLFSQSVRCGST